MPKITAIVLFIVGGLLLIAGAGVYADARDAAQKVTAIYLLAAGVGFLLHAALFASLSLVIKSFPSFCLAAYMMGWAGAATHQYRFSALEQVPASKAPQATSVLLLGGIFGAFIGPELAVQGQFTLIPGEEAPSGFHSTRTRRSDG